MKKGARALEDDVASDTVDLKKEVAEQNMRQMYGQLELEEFDEINDTHQGILTCQSYLREERPEELWMCHKNKKFFPLLFCCYLYLSRVIYILLHA